ncbi:MAG: OmpA family protein [Crocinitomicaceae bacterium]
MKVFLSFVLVLLICLAPSNAQAQRGSWLKIKKANKLRSFGKIESAVKKYETVLVGDPTNSAANFQLGKLNLLDLEDFGKAEKHLSTSIQNFDEKDTIYMAYYYLAETQKLLGNFPEAIENFNTFKLKGIKNQSKSKNLIDDINAKIDECKLGEAFATDTKYTFTRVINLGDNVNSNLSEYCSIFFPETEQLMYTARYQDSDKEKRFMDLKFFEGGYSVNDTNSNSESPKRIEVDKEDKSHFSVVSKTAFGDTVIFYKNNKLWISKSEDGKLSKPVLMPSQINRSYYQPHGTFTPDNKSFVFSSSDKNLQLDLYMVVRKSDNTWGEPTLLNDNINTKYNEDSPFFSKDGQTLYFSSNKPGGYGKYDIYFSKYSEGNWTDPLNIGMPINSSGEDIFFTLNEDNKTGFLSSNRGGGYGSMDIYMFTEQPYPSFDCEEYLAANGHKGLNDILIMDELVLKEEVRFDVSRAKLKDSKISNVFWKVDDQILKLDSPVLKYVFKDTGTHSVSTQIYGKNKKTDSYVMDCSTTKFSILSEGPLFLEIIADRNIKVDSNTIIDASTFYMGDNKEITDYTWYFNGVKSNIKKESYNYTFSDTGYQEIKVVANIYDKASDLSYELTSKKNVFVYDDSHQLQAIVNNGKSYVPGIDLYDNTNPGDGRINALKADVYGIPDDRRVFYSWYIDNAEIKGRQTEFLSYDFKPLSTVTVKAFIMHEAEEPEFTLEASKVIPNYIDSILPNTLVDNNGKTDNSNDSSNITTPIDPKDVIVDNGNQVTDDTLVDKNDNTNVIIDNREYAIEPVYFPFDKYYLTSMAKAIINKNIKALKANPSLKVIVEGNTDSMGPSSYNLRLSEKRAKSVYKYLISKGIPESQIKGINSNGERLPKASNTLSNGRDNPKGRQENRRVDFTIIK